MHDRTLTRKKFKDFMVGDPKSKNKYMSNAISILEKQMNLRVYHLPQAHVDAFAPEINK